MTTCTPSNWADVCMALIHCVMVVGIMLALFTNFFDRN